MATPQAPIIQLNYESLESGHSWSSKETANVKTMLNFVQLIMNDHAFDAVRAKHGSNNYKQHNRNMSEGIEGVIKTVEDLCARFPDYTYDVKRVHADGDYVIFHSHATLNRKDRGNDQKGMNITDTRKVVNGEILEHWDSVQPIDTFMRFYYLVSGGSIRNNNGVF